MEKSYYSEIRSISPYSVRMWEKNDQKKLRIWTIFTQCQFHVRFPYLTSFHLYLVYFCSLPLLLKTAFNM